MCAPSRASLARLYRQAQTVKNLPAWPPRAAWRVGCELLITPATEARRARDNSFASEVVRAVASDAVSQSALIRRVPDSDEPRDERVRQRHVGHRLHRLDLSLPAGLNTGSLAHDISGNPPATIEWE
ncbi:MAG: hypothetical protein WA970_01510 [Gammaproteobacteria bacterium]